MRRLKVLAVILAVIVMAACNPDVKVPEQRAKELAAKALARYCDDKKLSPQHFRLTEVGPSGDAQWLIVYVSSGIKPAQEVAVSIGRKGDVKLHMDIEGRDD